MEKLQADMECWPRLLIAGARLPQAGLSAEPGLGVHSDFCLDEPLKRSWLSASGYCKAPYLSLRSSLSLWGVLERGGVTVSVPLVVPGHCVASFNIATY